MEPPIEPLAEEVAPLLLVVPVFEVWPVVAPLVPAVVETVPLVVLVVWPVVVEWPEVAPLVLAVVVLPPLVLELALLVAVAKGRWEPAVVVVVADPPAVCPPQAARVQRANPSEASDEERVTWVNLRAVRPQGMPRCLNLANSE